MSESEFTGLKNEQNSENSKLSEPLICTDFTNYTDFFACVTVINAFILQRLLIRQSIRGISVIRENQRF